MVMRVINYLAEYGQRLIDLGYIPIPIQIGKKAPGFDNWQNARANKAQLQEWLEGGHRKSGVGINTKHTPAVDLDIRDEEVAKAMTEYIEKTVGRGLKRIGRYPKCLMLFRTNAPFRKMRSTIYVDEWGDKHMVEILCDGQQFVAYHVHPETNKPYYWPEEGRNPLEIAAKDLPLINVEQIDDIIAKFEEMADEKGWEVAKKAYRQAVAIDLDNPFLEDTAPILIKDDELRNRLMLIPHSDDYDSWLRVGMALYHQYDGAEMGLKLWDEWSESADNYDRDALERRWDDFAINGKRRAPVTARFIMRLSQEASEGAKQELTLEISTGFLSAKNLGEWEKVRKRVREAEIDSMSRATCAVIAKEARDRITGTKTPLSEIKKAISYQPKKVENTPNWCSPWLYDVSDDRFYNVGTKVATTQQGFNAQHDRHAMTKADILNGKSSPSTTAAALALNFFRIPVVNGRRYEPGKDAIFSTQEGTFANTYPEHEIPKKPEQTTPRDKQNIRRIKAHIAHLVRSQKEQRMFLDWLAWVVQNPGRHANYAVLLQGVQGDGKTFFAEMMRAVMGPSNVSMLNAHILHSDFTDWAANQCMAAIEEIRLVNEGNKYELLNRIKPFITNNIVEVHPKGKPVMNVRNTTNYLLFTNYRDAMPLDDTDRRYLILFSQWQRKEAIDTFKRTNPEYYVKLYAAIEESPGAIRQWLLEHEQDESFNPQGDAPLTEAKKYMIASAKPEFIQALDEILYDDNVPEVSQEVLDVTFLADYMVSIAVDFPAPKTLHLMLQRDGYEFLGRIRDETGVRRRLYSKDPEKFMRHSERGVIPNRKLIFQHISTRRARIEDDEL